MAAFPLLSTGAVTQYPLAITTGLEIGVVRFLDGKDQRYRYQGRTLRGWRIHLDLLNESEMSALELFFTAQQGAYLTFTFPDPASGTNVSNCRFAANTFLSEYEAVDAAGTSFWVLETNGKSFFPSV